MAMQIMVVIALAFLLEQRAALDLRHDTTVEATWGPSSLAVVELEDQDFWQAQWTNIRRGLLLLQAASGSVHCDVPPANESASSMNQSYTVNQAGLTSGLHGSEDTLNETIDVSNPAMLAPTLAILKSFYADAKKRIGLLNEREQKSKTDAAKRQKEHKDRLAILEERFQNHNMSAGSKKNATELENWMFSYWSRVRQRQHQQYHTSLKIVHALMDKMKLLINVYEKAISGSLNRKDGRKELNRVGNGIMPDVVFIQSSSTTAFCCSALAEVHSNLASFRNGRGFV